MTKHTPAPWIIDENYITDTVSTGIRRVVSVREKGTYRGMICRLQSAEHIGGITGDEVLANAALIVAAPVLSAHNLDMIDGLKSLMKMIPEFDNKGERVDAWDMARALLDDCEAMQKKAEGGASWLEMIGMAPNDIIAELPMKVAE